MMDIPKEPDSRFTFEKGLCPFKLVNASDFSMDTCAGNRCEFWTQTRNSKGCSIRTGAEAMDSISETLLQILGQLKTRK